MGISVLKNSLVFSLLMFINAAHAKVEQAEDSQLKSLAHDAQPALEALIRDISEFIELAHIPGISVGLVQDNEVYWHGAFGTKNDDEQLAVDSKTVFEAASLSKPLFSYLVLRLVDAGEFDLDQPLHELLEYPRLAHDERYKQITARLVLTHSTGLPNWGGDPLLIGFDPGTSVSYSGEGFLFLQKAIENKFGKSLDELAKQEVFEPLNMGHSSFTWQERFSDNSAYARDPFWNVAPIRKYSEGNAAGSLVTTAADYSNFVAAVLNGTGLSPEAHAAFLALGNDSDANVDSDIEGILLIEYGLGIVVVKSSEGQAFFHGGNNNNRFTSFMFGDLNTGNGFVFLTNSNEGTTLVAVMIERVTGEALDLDELRHDDPQLIASLSIQSAGVSNGAEAAKQQFELTRQNPESRLSVDTALSLSNILSNIGYSELSIEVLQATADDFPTSSEAYLALGSAFLRERHQGLALHAFNKALMLNPDNDDAVRHVNWIEETLAIQEQPVLVPAETLQSYVGRYDVRRVTLKEGSLYYQRDGSDEHRLIPISQERFALSGSDTFRIQFVNSDSGPAEKIIGIYSDGRIDESLRSR